MNTTDKPAQQPGPTRESPAAPASSGSGNGADSALAEMIRKRPVRVVETDQQLPAGTGPGSSS